MRIGIDAREICGRATGVGRYLAGLLTEWATDDRAGRHEFVLYAAEAPGRTFDTRRFSTHLIPGTAGTWWEQIKLPPALAADRLDVLFAPGYTLPLRTTVPAIVTIHDLSFFAHPSWFRTREGVRRRWLTRRAAARAREIMTVSDFVRGELVERLGVPEERIHVVPHGITSPLPSAVDAREEPRVLFVGSIFNRRHVPDLVRAFGRVARTHPGALLDIVGDNRTYPFQNIAQTVRAEDLGGLVRYHAYLPDERLRDLYARARAFAFLSEYEGFGLTPLEALAAGVPPVLLDTPVARENCGEAAEYVQDTTPAAVAAALERVLFDGDERRRILAAAPAVLARYSWRRAAQETLTIIEQVAAG